MTAANPEKRAQTATQDDYGQALAEGEITRILKTVQAAKFTKSETLAATEDLEFKPRSLVEIAFAAEKKRTQAEKVARQQQAQQQSEQADDAGPAAPDDQSGLPSVDQQAAILDEAAQQDGTAVPVSDEVAEKSLQAQQKNEAAALQKRAEEDEGIRLAAEEVGYKRGFEAGLEAARTAEPTAEEVALQAEKEQKRQAVVAKFHDAIAALASPQAVDSSALQAAINKAVIELASKRAGQVISQNPEEFLMRIRGLVDNIKAAAHHIDIFLNPADLSSMENWLEDGTTPSDWKFLADTQLLSGDIRLKIGGIEVADQLSIPSEFKSNALEEDLVGLDRQLVDNEMDEELADGLDEELANGLGEESDDGLDEDSDVGLDKESDDGLDEEIEISSRAENATVPARPPFIPEASEELKDADNDLFEGPESESSNESDKE